MTTSLSSEALTRAETAHSSADSVLQAIPWSDVTAVGIHTTDEGPFCDDVFWNFLTPERCFEIPARWVDAAGLDFLERQLPGLDWVKALRALWRAHERIARVWHCDESRYMPTKGDLRDRYCDLVARLGGNESAATAAFDAVHNAWNSDARSYHSVEHLVDCLYQLDMAKAATVATDVVEFALWYHDVVYDPRARGNEERSAQMLLNDAAWLGLPSRVASAAADLVRATAHANGAAAQPSTEAALILDIDLSIFGRDVLRFMDFEYGVEEEYAHVSEFWFRLRRGQFLAALLKRPQLFRTETFRARYEQLARAQIAKLLASPRYRAYRWLRWLRLVPAHR